MRPIDRRTRITAEINSKGYVTVAELSGLLNVSEVTIRADLSRLDHEGTIRRGFGGAMAIQAEGEKKQETGAETSDVPYETLWASTKYSTSMVEEKVRIAKTAAALVKDGEIIVLDGSNSSYYLSRELAVLNPRIVAVTNSMDILEVFRQASNTQTIVLGGEFHHRYNATFGALTEAAIRGINASKVFLSPKSLDVLRGALMDSSMANSVRRAMLEVATERYIMADHSKFSGRGILQLAKWSEITGIITDRLPPAEFLEAFTAASLSCMVAD